MATCSREFITCGSLITRPRSIGYWVHTPFGTGYDLNGRSQKWKNGHHPAVGLSWQPESVFYPSQLELVHPLNANFPKNKPAQNGVEDEQRQYFLHAKWTRGPSVTPAELPQAEEFRLRRLGPARPREKEALSRCGRWAVEPVQGRRGGKAQKSGRNLRTWTHPR